MARGWGGRTAIACASVIVLVLGGLLWAQRGPSKKAASETVRQSHPARAARQVTPKAPRHSSSRSGGAEAAPAATKTTGPGRTLSRYLVLFVLDGARPDYFSVSGIPHIQSLMRHGTRYTNAFAGILESETPSGHASIGTGSEPNQDGVLSFDWANSDNIPVDLFDPAKVRNGDLERIESQAGSPSIASLVHSVDPNAKVVALSGHKFYAADAMGGPDANAILYYSGTPDGKFAPTYVPGHAPAQGVLSPDLTVNTTHLPLGVEDHLTMRLARSVAEHMHPQALLVNVPEFDWPLGHVDGADRDPSGVRTLMQGFDRDLGNLENLYRKEGILDRTEFVLTADHGFAPIYHTVDDSLIKDAVAKAGTSIISDTYHTGAYLWLKDESRAAAAASNIAQLRNPYIQSVYFRETTANGFEYIRASGPDEFLAAGMEEANQYLLNTFNGPNGPDIVVQFAEDAGSEPGGQSTWKGDHGGSAWNSQHIPLVLSGPGIRPGYVSTYPARLMDIAPTVLTLLGVNPNGMHGIPLADALQHPAAGLGTAESELGTTLRRVVTALQNESVADVKAGR